MDGEEEGQTGLRTTPPDSLYLSSQPSSFFHYLSAYSRQQGKRERERERGRGGAKERSQ